MTETSPPASSPASAQATPAPAPALPPVAPVWTPPERPWWMTVVFVAALALSILLVLLVWRIGPFAGSIQRTDNALVRGRTVVLAPQVSGYVEHVLVRDYDRVGPGQLVALIDDDIYRARLAQAEANLALAKANLDNSAHTREARAAALSAQDAAIADAAAQLQRARADMARAADLVKGGAISVRERDQTAATLVQAEANLRRAGAGSQVAREDLASVSVNRAGLDAQVAAARAQVRLAAIDLLHTIIRAPAGGQLGEIHVRLGQFVTNGTALMELVPPDRYVIALFKEAQTSAMAVGQPASFTVDGLADRRFAGHITRIAPATGWEFAVLKPDNATGNFVKVPQRLGVLITLDRNQPAAARLRPGMSVVVSVDTAGGPR
jgi:hypothetical protein